MPSEGMRSALFHHPTTPPSTPNEVDIVSGCVSEIVSKAEALFMKWDPRGSNLAKVASLFRDSRDEASLFLQTVADLDRAMRHLMTVAVASQPATSARHDLVRAHGLMDAAMKRLQKEFFHVLSANCEGLDSIYSLPSASSMATMLFDDDDDDDSNTVSSTEGDEIKLVGEALRSAGSLPPAAMEDLNSIAECMVSAGYGKECVRIYTTIRRSIVNEGIYRLRFETLSPTQIRKLDWVSVAQRIKNWLTTAIFVFNRLFSGERDLCDSVFGSSSISIKESTFAEITVEPAVQFLEFPEIVAVVAGRKNKRISRSKLGKSKSRPAETMQHFMDLHNAITDLWPKIEKVFSYDATSAVRSQAMSSIEKLEESVRSTIAEFERSIRRDSTKFSKLSPAVGEVHPLTLRVVNDLALLADYGPTLEDIFIDQPLPFTVGAACSSSSSITSVLFEWLALVLLCKLDGKAELYKDVAISYLFLANNLRYIVRNVIDTPNLFRLVGEQWVRKHDEKSRWFASGCVRLGWAKVAAAVEEGKVGEFNAAFEDACAAQSSWVLIDDGMREEVAQLVRATVVAPYRALYERRREVATPGGGDEVVRYAPEDVEARLKAHLVSRIFGSESASELAGSGSSSRSGISRAGLE